MKRSTTNSEPASTPKTRKGGRRRVHADAAARQHAYRQRLRARGYREVTRVVRDVQPLQPLESDVIDLSATSAWRWSRRKP